MLSARSGGMPCYPPAPAPASSNIKGTLGYLNPFYMSTGTYTVHTDAYAMGVAMLVALTGRAAQGAMRVATLTNHAFEDPSQALEVADLTAGTPLMECIICMAAARSVQFACQYAGPFACRSVQFACGHMLCCEDCTEDLINAVAQTSWGTQNKCPSCRARHQLVVARGGAMASQATFVGMQMSTARSPVSSVDTNAPPSYSGLHWIRRPPPSYSAAVAPPSYIAATQQVPLGGDAGQQAGPSAETLAERARFRALSAPASRARRRPARAIWVSSR